MHLTVLGIYLPLLVPLPVFFPPHDVSLRPLRPVIDSRQ